VVKHRGISAASRRMPYGIQQPAISGQLSQLEKALGVRLFDRRPFGLRPAGAKLFNEIEPFFAGLGRLPAYVRGHAHEHLRLAAPGRILRDYLPVIWRATNISIQIGTYFARCESNERGRITATPRD